MAGMGLRATHNLPEVLGAIDAWAEAILQVAAPRALNKVTDQAETAGLRKVASIYGIGPRTMEKYATVQYAKQGNLEAVISVKGTGFPLYLFNPRVVRGPSGRRGRRVGGGIAFTFKGRTIFVAHAFIARMKSGHIGVFARGGFSGKAKNDPTGETFGHFYFGKNRYSINELFTQSAPGAFSNPDVTQAMNDRAEQQLPIVLAQEIRFATR